MSYILEALKKAEAERRTGNVPSIHAPHSFAPPRAARAWWQHPATWTAIVALLLAAAVAGWLLVRTPATPSVPVQVAAVPTPAPVAAHAPEPQPAATPVEPPVSAAPRTPTASPPPAAATASTSKREKHEPRPEAKPKAESRPEPKPRPQPAPAKQEQKEEQKQEQKEERRGPPPVAAKAPEQAPAPPLRELPEHIQREIPPLQIGGYIYSASPADRSVLINKRLVREGDEVAPGLTLEKMTPSGMVLNYRGHRYRSSY